MDFSATLQLFDTSTSSFSLLAYDTYHGSILLHGLAILLGILPTLSMFLFLYFAVTSFAAVAITDRNFMRWMMNSAVIFLAVNLLLGGMRVPGSAATSDKSYNGFNGLHVIRNPGNLGIGVSVAPFSAHTAPFETFAMSGLDSTDNEFAVADSGNLCTSLSVEGLIQGGVGGEMASYKINYTSGDSDNTLNSAIQAIQNRLAVAPMLSKMYIYLVNSLSSGMYAAFHAADVYAANSFQVTLNDQANSVMISATFLPKRVSSETFATYLSRVLETTLDAADKRFKGPTKEEVFAATNLASVVGSDMRYQTLADTSIADGAMEYARIQFGGKTALPGPAEHFKEDLENRTFSNPTEQLEADYNANASADAYDDPNGRDFWKTSAVPVREYCLVNTEAPTKIQSAAMLHPYYFYPAKQVSGKIDTSGGDTLFLGGFDLSTLLSGFASFTAGSTFKYEDAVKSLAGLAGNTSWSLTPSATSFTTNPMKSGGTLTLAQTDADLTTAIAEAETDHPDKKACLVKARDQVRADMAYIDGTKKFYTESDPIFKTKTDACGSFTAYGAKPFTSQDSREVFALAVSNDMLSTPGNTLAGSEVSAFLHGRVSNGGLAMATTLDGNLADLGSAVRNLLLPIASTTPTAITIAADIGGSSNVEAQATTDTNFSANDTGFDRMFSTVGNSDASPNTAVGVGGSDASVTDPGAGATNSGSPSLTSQFFNTMKTFMAIPMILGVLIMYVIAYYTVLTSAGLGVSLIPIWVALTGARMMMNPSASDESYSSFGFFPVIRFMISIVLIGVELCALTGIAAAALYFVKTGANAGLMALLAGANGLTGSVMQDTGMVGDALTRMVDGLMPLGIMVGLASVPAAIAAVLKGEMYQPKITPDVNLMHSMRGTGDISHQVAGQAGGILGTVGSKLRG